MTATFHVVCCAGGGEAILFNQLDEFVVVGHVGCVTGSTLGCSTGTSFGATIGSLIRKLVPRSIANSILTRPPSLWVTRL